MLKLAANSEFTLESCCNEIDILSFKCDNKRGFIVGIRLGQVDMLERVRLDEVLQRLKLSWGQRALLCKDMQKAAMITF